MSLSKRLFKFYKAVDSPTSWSYPRKKKGGLAGTQGNLLAWAGEEEENNLALPPDYPMAGLPPGKTKGLAGHAQYLGVTPEGEARARGDYLADGVTDPMIERWQEMMRDRLPPRMTRRKRRRERPAREGLTRQQSEAMNREGSSIRASLNKAEKDPFKTGESFTTLHNYEARKKEHDQLLREYGFPSEQDPEANRYSRFAEVETDGKGKVLHNKPPWIVAENSEMVAEINDEDAPSYSKSPKAKNREGENTMSLTKRLLKAAYEDSDMAHAYEENFSDEKRRANRERIASQKDRGREMMGTPSPMDEEGGQKMGRSRRGKAGRRPWGSGMYPEKMAKIDAMTKMLLEKAIGDRGGYGGNVSTTGKKAPTGTGGGLGPAGTQTQSSMGATGSMGGAPKVAAPKGTPATSGSEIGPTGGGVVPRSAIRSGSPSAAAAPAASTTSSTPYARPPSGSEVGPDTGRGAASQRRFAASGMDSFNPTERSRSDRSFGSGTAGQTPGEAFASSPLDEMYDQTGGGVAEQSRIDAGNRLAASSAADAAAKRRQDQVNTGPKRGQQTDFGGGEIGSEFGRAPTAEESYAAEVAATDIGRGRRGSRGQLKMTKSTMYNTLDKMYDDMQTLAKYVEAKKA